PALVWRAAGGAARERPRQSLADHQLGNVLTVRFEHGAGVALVALHRLEVEAAPGDDLTKTECGAIAELALGCALCLCGLRRVEAAQTVSLAVRDDRIAVHDPDVGRRDVLGCGRAGQQSERDWQYSPEARFHVASPRWIARRPPPV